MVKILEVGLMFFSVTTHILLLKPSARRSLSASKTPSPNSAKLQVLMRWTLLSRPVGLLMQMVTLLSLRFRLTASLSLLAEALRQLLAAMGIRVCLIRMVARWEPIVLLGGRRTRECGILPLRTLAIRTWVSRFRTMLLDLLPAKGVFRRCHLRAAALVTMTLC